MRHWLVLILFLLGLGTLRVMACGEESCVEQIGKTKPLSARFPTRHNIWYRAIRG